MYKGANDLKYSQIGNTNELESVPEVGTFCFGKNDKNSLDGAKNKGVIQRSMRMPTNINVPKKKRNRGGFFKFYKNNGIQECTYTVGDMEYFRINKDGISRNHNKSLKEAKERQELENEKNRKLARKQILMRRRTLEPVETESDKTNLRSSDMLFSLQTLVLQDAEIASSLFYDLFDALYDKEPDEQIKEELAKEAVNILYTSVACDTSLMSAVLLILIKLCKTHSDMDIKAIERVGIKSLNFSKAILLLEELIINEHKNSKADVLKAKPGNEFNNNKAWISLKRLHEASGKGYF